MTHKVLIPKSSCIPHALTFPPDVCMWEKPFYSQSACKSVLHAFIIVVNNLLSEKVMLPSLESSVGGDHKLQGRGLGQRKPFIDTISAVT